MAIKKLTKSVLIAAHDDIDDKIGIDPVLDEELGLLDYEKALYGVIVDPDLQITDEEIKTLDKTTQEVIAMLKEKYSEEPEADDEDDDDDEPDADEEPGEDDDDDFTEADDDEDDDDDEDEDEDEDEPAPPPAKKDKTKEPEKPMKKGKEEAKPEKKSAAKEKPAPAEKAKKEKKEKQTGPGVIASIAEFLEGSGKTGITKEGLLEKLKTRFPDREEKSMRNTVNVQIPNRMAKEKGWTILKKETGEYYKKMNKN